MFHATRNQINEWRWGNPRAFPEDVDRSNLQTTNSEQVKCTSEHFSWYGHYHLWANIEPPSCWQYKPGDFLAVGPLNWDEIIDDDDDDENWADPGVPSSARSYPGDGIDNDDGKGVEDMQGSDKGTR